MWILICIIGAMFVTDNMTLMICENPECDCENCTCDPCHCAPKNPCGCDGRRPKLWRRIINKVRWK